MNYARQLVCEGENLELFSYLKKLKPELILIYGSVGYELGTRLQFADKYTHDLDLMLVCEETPSIEERNKILEKIGTLRKEYHQLNPDIDVYDVGRENLKEVSIMYVPKSVIRNRLETFQHGFFDPDFYDQLALIYFGHLVYDEGLGKKIKTMDYPEELRKRECFWIEPVLNFTREFFPKTVERRAYDFAWRSLIERRLLLDRVVFALAKLPFGKSLIKWLPKFYQLSSFDYLPSEFRKLTEDFSDPHGDLKEKVEILDKMGEILLPIIRKELPNLELEIPRPIDFSSLQLK